VGYRRLYTGTKVAAQHLGLRVRVPIEEVGVAFPSRTVSIGVRIALWWGIDAVHGVSVLNGRGSIIALNGGMLLHTTGLADGADPNRRP